LLTSPDDYSSLGIRKEQIAPSAEEILNKLNEQFPIHNIGPEIRTNNMEVTALLSFRTPATEKEKVTNQLPICGYTAYNVDISKIQTQKFKQELIQMIKSEGQNQYPCNMYKTNHIPFQLTKPRIGFWQHRETTLLETKVHKDGSNIPLQIHQDDLGFKKVFISISFHIAIQNQAQKQQPEVRTPQMKQWASELLRLTKEPLSIQTMQRFTELANQIQEVKEEKPRPQKRQKSESSSSSTPPRSVRMERSDHRQHHDDLRRRIVIERHRRPESSRDQGDRHRRHVLQRVGYQSRKRRHEDEEYTYYPYQH